MTGTMLHQGKPMITNPNWPIRYWECWCGAKWLSEEWAQAYLWCPLAPAGPGTTAPPGALSVAVTTPDWAASGPMPHVVEARVGGVSTTLATTATAERALLVAQAVQLAYENAPGKFRQAW